MVTVLAIHSVIRFAILAVATAGLAKTIISLASRTAPARLDQTLATIFVGLFDLQALIGLLIILLGGLVGPLHPLLMFIALVIAHWVQSVLRQAQGASANQIRLVLYAAPLSIVLFSLALIGHLPV